MFYIMLSAASPAESESIRCNSESFSAQVKLIKQLSDTAYGDRAVGDLDYWWDQCVEFQRLVNKADLNTVGDLLSVPNARVVASKFIIDLYPRSKILSHRLILAYKDQRRREREFKRESIITPPLSDSISRKMKEAIRIIQHGGS